MPDQVETATRPVSSGRLIFIDNLRWSAISMVVVLHAAVTYSGIGDWYVRDRAHTPFATVVGLATYQSVQHAVAMGLLFGIAGYFAAAALRRRSIASFLRERCFRLGLPLLLYTLVIGPLTNYFVAGNWHSRPPRGLVGEWLLRAVDGELLSGSGPLWFCLVLLLFSFAFAAVERIWPHDPGRLHRPVPGLATVALFVCAMALATFVIAGLTPGVGAVLNVPVHDFAQYPMMFAAGVLAHRHDWLLRFPRACGPACAIGGLVGGLLWWFLMLDLGGAFRGELAAFGGGWHWQALAMAFWRSSVCLALAIGLVTLYRDHFNRQGRVSRFLTRNAFGVYLFHPPILIAITVALHDWPIESLVKFLLASIAAVVGTFLFVGIVARRTPLLRAVL